MSQRSVKVAFTLSAYLVTTFPVAFNPPSRLRHSRFLTEPSARFGMTSLLRVIPVGSALSKRCHSEPTRSGGEEPALVRTTITAGLPHSAAKSSHVGFF